MLFQKLCNLGETLVCLREALCHFFNALRRADARHDIFALRIDQKLSVERIFSCRRVAGKGNTGS